MKTFQEVLVDIQQNLIGVELHSISGSAAPFRIEEVDYANNYVLLDVQSSRKTWSFERLQKVWDEMCLRPAANVEVVFGGSGSSRNQVETIFASLSYVEWLYVNNKKCIAYVGEETHPYGELKQMDADTQIEYNHLMAERNPRNPLLPPEANETTPNDYTREELLELENKDFIFACLDIMSRHHLFNGYTLPILESRESCALLFRHNNMHGILFRKERNLNENELRAAIRDEGGSLRYYAEAYSIGEDEFFVSSQWRPDREDARGAFLDWLFELLLSIKFTTGLESAFERNRIVFGAPGTGKSHQLKEDCAQLLDGTSGSYERVTFHPEYSYSNFVGCYKPVTNKLGEICYKFVPGPFMRVLVAALKSGRTDNPQPHLLLIEEINRAKVAAVFGEVFQLLDRDDNGVSEYEIHATEDIKNYLIAELGKSPDVIKIPDNMFIWATMNSADQGVYPMDTAFKRRWNFEYLGIDENDDTVGGIITLGTGTHAVDIDWNQLRRAINEKLATEYHVNEDKLMGPFFLGRQVFAYGEDGRILKPEKFKSAFKSKVIMYLYEDAAKQQKHKLFEGCDSSKYSSVCRGFDEMGIEIFGPDFKSLYDRMEG
jgi:hypothetical protein